MYHQNIPVSENPKNLHPGTYILKYIFKSIVPEICSMKSSESPRIWLICSISRSDNRIWYYHPSSLTDIKWVKVKKNNNNFHNTSKKCGKRGQNRSKKYVRCIAVAWEKVTCCLLDALHGQNISNWLVACNNSYTKSKFTKLSAFSFCLPPPNWFYPFI